LISQKLSVVIPTYNRQDLLRKALEGYSKQSARQEILEILVVDDGSTDATRSLVARYREESALPVRYLRQESKGAGAARNHGVREARGAIVLFGDDDIVPAPNLVGEHLAWHDKYPDPAVAVLGQVILAQEIRPTPFLKWFHDRVFNSTPSLDKRN